MKLITGDKGHHNAIQSITITIIIINIKILNILIDMLEIK